MRRDAIHIMETRPNTLQSAVARAGQTLATDIGTVMSISLKDKPSAITIVVLLKGRDLFFFF